MPAFFFFNSCNFTYPFALSLNMLPLNNPILALLISRKKACYK